MIKQVHIYHPCLTFCAITEFQITLNKMSGCRHRVAKKEQQHKHHGHGVIVSIVNDSTQHVKRIIMIGKSITFCHQYLPVSIEILTVKYHLYLVCVYIYIYIIYII